VLYLYASCWQNLLSGLIGAVIGGIFTIFGAIIACRHQKKMDDISDKKEQNIFLLSIKAEITV